MDHRFVPDMAHFVPAAGAPTGTLPPPPPSSPPTEIYHTAHQQPVSPTSHPLRLMPEPSLVSPSLSLIHTVYLYNIPPETKWKDVKGLLMNYIPDSTLLHIQIYSLSSCAVISLSDKESADILFEQLEGHEWNERVLATSWTFDTMGDSSDPSNPGDGTAATTTNAAGAIQRTPIPLPMNHPQHYRYSSMNPNMQMQYHQEPPYDLGAAGPQPPLLQRNDLGPGFDQPYPPVPMEMYSATPQMIPMSAAPYGYPMPRPPSSSIHQNPISGLPTPLPPHMMGYFGPFPGPPPPPPPPQHLQASQGGPAYGPPQAVYYNQPYYPTRSPVPQLSHFVIPSSQSPLMGHPRSNSFNNNSNTSSAPSPIFSYRGHNMQPTALYNQRPPTVSARQLGSLRQYPYQSIMDFNINSTHSSRNSSIITPTRQNSLSISNSTTTQNNTVDLHRLFIGNIPYETSWMDLKDYLREAGSIARVEIPEQSPGVSRGFAIATYEYEEDATRAIEMFDGHSFLGRELMVRYDKFPKKQGSSVSVVQYEHEDSGHGDEGDEEKAKEEKEQEEKEEDDKGNIQKKDELVQGINIQAEHIDDNEVKSYISRLVSKHSDQEDFDDKKFADEARNLVESLSMVALNKT